MSAEKIENTRLNPLEAASKQNAESVAKKSAKKPAETASEQSGEPDSTASTNKQATTRIDLLRHGQVATPSLFSAPDDEPLGMTGWKQLTVATQNGHWDLIISSTTRRCYDFARLLSQRQDCPFIPDDRLCELDFGAWVGLTQQEIFARDPELLQQYYYQPRRFVAPEGESMDYFTRRVYAAWDDILAEHAGKRILVLTHTGVIRVLISKALDVLYQKSLRFEVGYAHFTRLQIYPDGEVNLLAHGLPAA